MYENTGDRSRPCLPVIDGGEMPGMAGSNISMEIITTNDNESGVSSCSRQNGERSNFFIRQVLRLLQLCSTFMVPNNPGTVSRDAKHIIKSRDLFTQLAARHLMLEVCSHVTLSPLLSETPPDQQGPSLGRQNDLSLFVTLLSLLAASKIIVKLGTSA